MKVLVLNNLESDPSEFNSVSNPKPITFRLNYWVTVHILYNKPRLVSWVELLVTRLLGQRLME